MMVVVVNGISYASFGSHWENFSFFGLPSSVLITGVELVMFWWLENRGRSSKLKGSK